MKAKQVRGREGEELVFEAQMSSMFVSLTTVLWNFISKHHITATPTTIFRLYIHTNVLLQC